MTELQFDEKYREYLGTFNSYLYDVLNEIRCVPELLGESLRYSVLLGGKRIRPVLMLAAGELLEVPVKTLLPYAAALELIHTYSLIHDDLPCMDNDDFRRGKPSNHKVFGEANAVLAGDGLLNTAYSMLFDECFKGKNHVSAAKYVCDCAGIYGMIAGQSADLLYEKQPVYTEEALNSLYDNKTGKLLCAALAVPSILTEGKYYAELRLFGEKLGRLFQLTDDVLDVEGAFGELGKSIGKDSEEGKLTGVQVFGLENCKLRIDLTGDECHKILDGLNVDADFLHRLVDFIKTRKN